MITDKFTYEQILEDNSKLKEELSLLKSKHGNLRALNAQRLFSQLIIREEDEAQLLNSICKITVDEIGYKGAWIGLSMEDKSIYPVASSGFDPEHSDDFKIECEDGWFNQSYTGKVVRSGKYCVMHDILNNPKFQSCRDNALKFGFKSSLTLPLYYNKLVIGVIKIYSEEENAFDEEEINILSLAANDLSIGISNIRYERTIERQAEELYESNLKYQTFFEQDYDGVVIIEPKTASLIEFNNQACKQLGYTREEFAKLTVFDIEAQDTKEVTRQKIENVISSGKEDFKTRQKTKTGEIRDIFVSARIINISGKKIYHCIWRDITESKRNEMDLINAKEKAEESDRLKSAFLANMSHEIRTPMNSILGFAELLNEPDLSGEKKQDYLRIIEKSGARMLNTINSIIEISKIESWLVEVDITESNINEQIEYMHSFFKPEAEKKGIRLTFKNPLPDKEAILILDREKLYAILTNLVKNAIKFTEKGLIEFGYEKKKDFIEFYVRDTGIGIPMERQEAIFERFVQADIGDKRAYQGSGLGLAITKSYVEIMGGKIWVESSVGMGSSFYFTIPYTKEPQEKNGLGVKKSEAGKVYPGKKLKVLIAEDDETSGFFISEVIQEISSEIISVSTGTRAVSACQENPDIDLVLMDIKMPEMDGYQATRQIRQFNKDVIIIAQTAYGLSGDREKAIEAGCNDYVSKPVEKGVLMGLFEKYFNK